MNPYYRRFDSPLMRLLALVVGAVAMVGAFFVGAFVLTLAIGLFVVIAIAVSFRVWRLRRQMQRAARQSPDQGDRHVVIEGEYIVHRHRNGGDDQPG